MFHGGAPMVNIVIQIDNMNTMNNTDMPKPFRLRPQVCGETKVECGFDPIAVGERLEPWLVAHNKMDKASEMVIGGIYSMLDGDWYVSFFICLRNHWKNAVRHGCCREQPLKVRKLSINVSKSPHDGIQALFSKLMQVDIVFRNPTIQDSDQSCDVYEKEEWTPREDQWYLPQLN